MKIFSRNCEDRSGAFPDVVDTIRSAAQGGCKSAVLDTELVAVDRNEGNRLKPFQELSTRARGDVTASQVWI